MEKHFTAQMPPTPPDTLNQGGLGSAPMQQNKHEGMTRGFHWLSQAWYNAPSLIGREFTDEINFGYFDPASHSGGTTGEIMMRWYDLGSAGIAPRLEAFDDAWHALFTFQDVLAALAERDGKNITPKQFVELLTSLGFVDLTQRENPYGKREGR